MPGAKNEFAFPDEKDEKKDDEVSSELEIEVVDDTPPEDKGRQDEVGKTVEDPTEDELQSYGEKVKNRIEQLTLARHTERRAAEQAAREKEEALRYAQAALRENEELKKKLEKSSEASATQTEQLATVSLEQAKEKLKKAYEGGNADEVVAAQTDLARATMALERAKMPKPEVLQPEKKSDTVQPRTQQPPVEDPKAAAWRAKNSWFGTDVEATSFVLGVHNKLVSAGYDTSSDAYYQALNTRMKQKFPELFEEKNDTKETKADEKADKKPANIVAPATRNTGPKKIRLTQSQVAIAKRLGVPLEKYAAKVAELERNNG